MFKQIAYKIPILNYFMWLNQKIEWDAFTKHEISVDLLYTFKPNRTKIAEKYGVTRERVGQFTAKLRRKGYLV